MVHKSRSILVMKVSLTLLVGLVAVTSIGTRRLHGRSGVEQLASATGSRAGALLEELCRRYELPAMAAAVVRSDAPPQLTVAGVRRKGAPTAVSIADRFHIGSNAKAIAATVIARLVEDGRLAWTHRAIDVFPELAASVHAAYREVTIEQLLRHRAGVPAYGTANDTSDAQARWTDAGSATEQRRAFSTWLLRRTPGSPPGRMVYSNAGYVVAAAMAEAAAGESWETLLQKKLAVPLGLQITHGWPARGEDAQPWGHRPALFRGLQPHDPDANDRFQRGALFRPAGDVALSIADYATFLRLHLAGHRGRDGIVRAATIQHLHSGPGEYALGWGIRQWDGTTAYVHAGSAGTFIARVWLVPDRDVAVAVFVNARSGDAERAVDEAGTVLLTEHGAQSRMH